MACASSPVLRFLQGARLVVATRRVVRLAVAAVAWRVVAGALVARSLVVASHRPVARLPVEVRSRVEPSVVVTRAELLVAVTRADRRAVTRVERRAQAEQARAAEPSVEAVAEQQPVVEP